MKNRHIFRERLALLVPLLLFGLLTTAGTALAAEGIQLTEAKWESGDKLLVVKGQNAGGRTTVTLKNASTGAVLKTFQASREGRFEQRVYNLNPAPCQVRVETRYRGSDERDVSNAPPNCDGGGTTPPPVSGDFTVLAANDLGMHCADLDYDIFTILPPLSVVHAQVIQKGTGLTDSTRPKVLTGDDVDVVYSATSNPKDPKGPGSINTTNDPLYLGFDKTNFWDLVSATQTLGGLAYRLLYPGQQVLGLCDATAGPCASALDLFEPLAVDVGIPVPDPVHLPDLVVGQQHMPGPNNEPQHFDRFDADLPFFTGFPFGFTVTGANWFAADGIPIVPIDDNGNENAYPLMSVQAVTKGADPTVAANIKAGVDVVLPVASEADCQGCHAASDDPALTYLGFVGNGAAADFAGTSFTIQYAASAPGDTALNQLQNAAKINILRLHDAKHGPSYESWQNTGASAALVSTPCNAAADPSDPDCLANQTPIQCSQCHYSPALDPAQAGPVDEPEQGPRGRQQRHHISQSRAMHGHHGQFADLFPPMPPPNDADRLVDQGITPVNDFELGILEETCYQCHPGKNTKCLRGAMFNGGMVCQDCHGDMAQVGNDFTERLASSPFPAGANLNKRVPWATEPGCQSCHTGDALDNLAGDYPDLAAPDGIRLLQAYEVVDAVDQNGDPDGTELAQPIAAPGSRFAENQSLFRLSQGHGGVKCEGCHGSTHAIWPVSPREGPFVANDNLAATQLQGHDGKIQECDTCHAGGLSDYRGLEGPHGMHVVGDTRFSDGGHESIAESNPEACFACHGGTSRRNSQGTVLSTASMERTLRNEGRTVTVAAGDPVGCVLCHGGGD
jgi:hypothetical protein